MKNTIKKIIFDFHSGGAPQLIERNYNIPLSSKKIVSIIGPRRAGKTYILFQFIKKLSAKIDKKKILYLNFEDERLFFNNNYDIIFEAYFELYPEINKHDICLFLDEIQELPNWEKFIRRVYDSITKNIFITGSNSKMLSSDIATSLRGRTISYEILPLTFFEHLKFKNTDFPDDIYSIKSVSRLKRYFEEYMIFGFYPEIVLIDDKQIKQKILQEYFNTVIYRDLVEHYNISNIKILKFIMKKLYASFTKEYSINKIYNELKSMSYRISKDKLYELIHQIESVYFFYSLEKKEKSIIKNEISNKKVYTFDNGIIYSLSCETENDLGKYFENLLFNEIYKKFGDIKFYKNDYECDFIFKKQKQVVALQAVYLLNQENFQRELKGLKKTMEKFKIKTGCIVYYETDIKFSKIKDVEILNVFEFYRKYIKN